MTKFILNNGTDRHVAIKTDITLFFTITNCQIFRSRSLTHRINYKFMCLSACSQKLANERARILVVIVKSSSSLVGSHATYIDQIGARKQFHGFCRPDGSGHDRGLNSCCCKIRQETSNTLVLSARKEKKSKLISTRESYLLL